MSVTEEVVVENERVPNVSSQVEFSRHLRLFLKSLHCQVFLMSYGVLLAACSPSTAFALRT